MLINNGVIVWTANDLYRELEQWDGTTVFQVDTRRPAERRRNSMAERQG